MNAKPRNEPAIKAIIKDEHNILSRIDQCQYGLWIEDIEDWTEAMKPTKSLTNPTCIANQLKLRCPGNDSYVAGKRAFLFDGRPTHAQVYPELLCDAICGGITKPN